MEYAIVRGVNLTGLFENGRTADGERTAAPPPWHFSRSDAERIIDMGFDHVRILLERDPFAESGDREASDRLLRVLDLCEDVALKTVVAFGKAGPCIRGQGERNGAAADPPGREAPERRIDAGGTDDFVDRWIRLAEALHDFPTDMVAYGIRDEHGTDAVDEWNERCSGTIRAIRDREPDRPLVVESAGGGRVETLAALRLPPVDNLILSIRTYRPILVTHYGIPLPIGLHYEGPVRYPGAPIPDEEFEALDPERHQALRSLNIYRDRYIFAEELESSLENRNRTDLPLYCGEFGCSRALDPEIRTTWLHDVISVLDRMHAGWAVREYYGPFGLLDEERNETGILPILMDTSYLG